MPAATTMPINDGKATPVSHVFTPVDVQRSKDGATTAVFHNMAASTPLGREILILTLQRPKDTDRNGFYDVKWTLKVPTLETLGTADTGITPPPTIAFYEQAYGSFRYSVRGSAAGRKDIRVIAANLLATSTMTTLAESLEAIY